MFINRTVKLGQARPISSKLQMIGFDQTDYGGTFLSRVTVNYDNADESVPRNDGLIAVVNDTHVSSVCVITNLSCRSTKDKEVYLNILFCLCSRTSLPERQPYGPESIRTMTNL